MPVLVIQVSGSGALPEAEITVLLYSQLSIALLTRKLGLDSRVNIGRWVLKAVPHLLDLYVQIRQRTRQGYIKSDFIEFAPRTSKGIYRGVDIVIVIRFEAAGDFVLDSVVCHLEVEVYAPGYEV